MVTIDRLKTMTNILKKYVLYQSESQNNYTLIEEGDTNNFDLLENDAILIWSVEAASWEGASSMQHEYLGWEPYKPMKL